jgi:hypothetical protein
MGSLCSALHPLVLQESNAKVELNMSEVFWEKYLWKMKWGGSRKSYDAGCR